MLAGYEPAITGEPPEERAPGNHGASLDPGVTGARTTAGQ